MALAYYWCPLSQYGLDRGINYSAKSKFLLRPMTFSHKSFLLVINVNEIRYSMLCRPVIPWGAEGAMAPPDFGRPVNPISTRRGRLCPPHYYRHPRIFRPSYGPDTDMIHVTNKSSHVHCMSVLCNVLCIF